MFVERKYTHQHHAEKKHATTSSSSSRLPTTITHEPISRQESYDYNDSNSPSSVNNSHSSVSYNVGKFSEAKGRPPNKAYSDLVIHVDFF